MATRLLRSATKASEDQTFLAGAGKASLARARAREFAGMPRTAHKFGPAARRRFLDHLRETGHLGQSAAAAGVHYTTTRRRLLPGHQLYDPTLVDDVEEARLAYAEKLLAEAYRRGVEGWIERGLYVNDRSPFYLVPGGLYHGSVRL